MPGKQPWPERFWRRVKKSPGCWIWTGYTAKRNGYGYVGLPGSRNTARTHRVSWELSHGLIPNGLYVLHSCDNPPCVNPEHLFLGTQADNMRDMVNKGRASFGEAHCNARLTKGVVSEIRSKYRKGSTSYRKLAIEYGIAHITVGKIIRRETWKDVP